MKPLDALLAAALALLLLSTAPAHGDTLQHSAQGEIVDSVHLAGVIEVDASGRVEQVSLRRNRLSPKIEESVLSVMHRWTFDPYLQDGQARRIRTSMHARVDQVRSEAGYQVVLGEVEFGQPLAQSTPAPRYPGSALKNGVSAEVLLRVTLDESGGVAFAEPVMARVLNRAVRNEERHRRLLAPFTRVSVEALQNWRFEFVPPSVDGERPQMLVPLVFTVDGPSARVGGSQPQSQPVLFELSSPLGRPLEALAREAEGRSEGLLITPAASPLKLRSDAQAEVTM